MSKFVFFFIFPGQLSLEDKMKRLPDLNTCGLSDVLRTSVFDAILAKPSKFVLELISQVSRVLFFTQLFAAIEIERHVKTYSYKIGLVVAHIMYVNNLYIPNHRQG